MGAQNAMGVMAQIPGGMLPNMGGVPGMGV